jgi:hypothetical protein
MNKSWSYSHYSTLLRCKQLYQYQIIDKLPSEQVATGELEFGTCLHTALNASILNKDAHAIFELEWEKYENSGIEFSWKHNYTTLRDMGLQFITKFNKGYKKDIVLIEAENRLFGNYEDLKLEGTPDLIASYKGKPTLFDFKSSAYSYDKDKVLNSLQMHLYAYLAKQNKVADIEQLCYLVFCKDKGSIQTPIIEKYSEEKALLMLKDMREYINSLGTRIAKNPNACYFGRYKCNYFDKCWKEV